MADLDLLALTAALVDIPSVSHYEEALTDHLEAELRAQPHLDVERVGDNLVARTHLDRPTRVVLAGHTDTVPVNGNAGARIDGDVLWGLGSADMKGGLAVMLALAQQVLVPAVDVTYVFYAGRRWRPSTTASATSCATGPTCWPATSPSSASPRAASSRPGARAP